MYQSLLGWGAHGLARSALDMSPCLTGRKVGPSVLPICHTYLDSYASMAFAGSSRDHFSASASWVA